MRHLGIRSTRRYISSAPGILAFALLASPSLSAQAICSAPHSSPTLAQSGSLRTLPPGAGWIQASIFGQRATQFFDARGDRQPFLQHEMGVSQRKRITFERSRRVRPQITDLG